MTGSEYNPKGGGASPEESGASPADAGRAAGLTASAVPASRSSIPDAVTDHDLFYLRSCLTHLRQLHTLHWETAVGVSLGSEALSDNIDWLDCFIDQWERRNAQG